MIIRHATRERMANNPNVEKSGGKYHLDGFTCRGPNFYQGKICYAFPESGSSITIGQYNDADECNWNSFTQFIEEVLSDNYNINRFNDNDEEDFL